MKSILGFWAKTAHLLFSLMGATGKIKRGSAAVFPAANLVAGEDILRGGHCSVPPTPHPPGKGWSPRLMDNHWSGLMFFPSALGPVPGGGGVA